MERGHSGVPGGIRQHRFIDEQGGRFGSFRPSGFQARTLEDWRTDCYHPARHLSKQNNTPDLAYETTHSAFTIHGAKAGSDYLLGVAGDNGKAISF